MHSDLPDTFEVHGSNFDDMSRLLAFKDTIATSTRHSSDVEKFGAVNHVVVFTSRHTHAVGLDLKA